MALRGKYQRFKEKSEKISEENCEKWLMSAKQFLIEKVSGGYYAVSKGYQIYLNDITTLHEKYKKCRHLGNMVS